MKKLDKQFRCDLCGQFANRGVTETSAADGMETRICWSCLKRALEVLFDF